MKRSWVFLICATVVATVLIALPVAGNIRHGIRTRFEGALDWCDTKLAAPLFNFLHRPPPAFKPQARSAQIGFNLAEFMDSPSAEMEIFLDIKNDGFITFNESPAATPSDDRLDGLQHALERIIKRFDGKIAKIIITAAPSVTCRRTSRVINLCIGLGYEDIKLGMEKPGTSRTFGTYLGRGPYIQVLASNKTYRPKLKHLTGCALIYGYQTWEHHTVWLHRETQHEKPEELLSILQQEGVQEKFDRSATPWEPPPPKTTKLTRVPPACHPDRTDRFRPYPLWENGTGRSNLSLALVRVANDCPHSYFWRLTQAIATAGITNMVLETYAPMAKMSQKTSQQPDQSTK